MQRRVGVNICGSSATVTHARPGLRYVPIIDLAPVTTYLCHLRAKPNASSTLSPPSPNRSPPTLDHEAGS